MVKERMGRGQGDKARRGRKMTGEREEGARRSRRGLERLKRRMKNLSGTCNMNDKEFDWNIDNGVTALEKKKHEKRKYARQRE